MNFVKLFLIRVFFQNHKNEEEGKIIEFGRLQKITNFYSFQKSDTYNFTFAFLKTLLEKV